MFTKNELRKLAVELFDAGSIKAGTFRSPIYIDFKNLISHPQLSARLSAMLWLLTDPKVDYDRVCGVPFDASSRCGVPYTAITYAHQISTLAGVKMLMRRRNNRQASIEGEFEIGDRVAIVDDEVGNGSNILEIVVDLAKEKLKIDEALVVVDREQGGRENLANAGVMLKSLFGIAELIGYLREAGKIPVYHARATPRNHTGSVTEFAAREMPGCARDPRGLYCGV